MILKSTSVLSEVARLEKAIKATRRRDEDFSELHQQVLDLSVFTLGRKFEYRHIDVEYPREIIVETHVRGNVNTLNVVPDTKQKLNDLSDNLFSVLACIRARYSTLRKIEQREATDIRTEVKRLASRVGKIEKSMNIQHKLRKR
jgi:hypothetical protein